MSIFKGEYCVAASDRFYHQVGLDIGMLGSTMLSVHIGVRVVGNGYGSSR